MLSVPALRFTDEGNWHTGHDCLLACEGNLLALYGLDLYRTLYAKWDFAYSPDLPSLLYTVGESARTAMLQESWEMEFLTRSELPPGSWSESVLEPVRHGHAVLISVSNSQYPLATEAAQTANEYPHYIVVYGCQGDALLVLDGWYHFAGPLPESQVAVAWQGFAAMVTRLPGRTPTDAALLVEALRRIEASMLRSGDPSVGLAGMRALADAVDLPLTDYLIQSLPHVIRERYGFQRWLIGLANSLPLPDECLDAVSGVLDGWTAARSLSLRAQITRKDRDLSRLQGRLLSQIDQELHAISCLQQFSATL